MRDASHLLSSSRRVRWSLEALNRMSSLAASNQSQIIINITFGIVATVISITTIWQGHRAWRLWRELCYRQQTALRGPFPSGRSIVIEDTHTALDIELGSTPPVPLRTSDEEPGNGHSQDHPTCGTSTPKASNPGSAIARSLKDVGPLEAIPSLDLLATEPWEKVTTLFETLPSPFNRSLASSRSEIELRMPPKPTLLRNSRSLEEVPHFSLD